MLLHSFGLVNYHYIARQQPVFPKHCAVLLMMQFERRRLLAARAFDGSGASWVTVVGDMVIDFGMIGGLFVIFIISMLIGRKRAVFLNAPNNSYELSFK